MESWILKFFKQLNTMKSKNLRKEKSSVKTKKKDRRPKRPRKSRDDAVIESSISEGKERDAGVRDAELELKADHIEEDYKPRTTQSIFSNVEEFQVVGVFEFDIANRRAYHVLDGGAIGCFTEENGEVRYGWFPFAGPNARILGRNGDFILTYRSDLSDCSGLDKPALIKLCARAITHVGLNLKRGYDVETLLARGRNFMKQNSLYWRGFDIQLREFIFTDEFAGMIYKYHEDRSKQQHLFTKSLILAQCTQRGMTYEQALPYVEGSLRKHRLALAVIICAVLLFFKPLMGVVALTCVWLCWQTLFHYKMELPDAKIGVPYASIAVPLSCVRDNDMKFPPKRSDSKIEKSPKTDNECPHREIEVAGCLIEDCPITVAKGCPCNGEAGLRIRYMEDKTRRGIVKDPQLINQVIDNFIDWVEKLPKPAWPHLSEEDWKSHLTPRRKKDMDKAGPIQPKSWINKFFVKLEAYVWKAPSSFKPRIISVRQDEYQAHVGTWFYNLSCWLSQLLKTNDFRMTSGMSAEELGAFASRLAGFKHLIELDVSNWDGSIEREWFRLEKWIITNLAPVECPVWDDIKHNWNTVKGSSMGIKYTMKHSRRSGDMWTSSFNGIINLAICIALFGADSAAGANGDDNITGTDKDISDEAIGNFYSRLGMEVEVAHRDLDTLSFNSGYFWSLADGTRKWGVNPIKQIAKFGINKARFPKAMHNQLLRGTALSLLPIAGHVPLMGFLHNLANYDCKARYPEYWEGKTTSSKVDEVCMRSFDQLSRICGVEPEALLIEHYRLSKLEMQDFPCIIRSSTIKQAYHNLKPTPLVPFYTVESEPEIIKPRRPWGLLGLVTLSAIFEEILIAMLPEIRWIFFIYEVHIYAESTIPLRVIAYLLLAGFQSAFGNYASGLLHILWNVCCWLFGVLQNTNSIMTNNNRRRNNRRRRQRKTKNSSMKSILKTAVKEALILGGGALGGTIGGPEGAMIGSKAGALLSKITGMGDYTIKKNSLLTNGATFGNDSRSVRITHHEYLGDVTASTSFESTSYPINPGLAYSFPWLAQLSSPFQQYQIHGMVFYYRPTSAEWSGNGQALGTVIMGTQYNIHKPPFGSKIEMENYQFSVSGKPSAQIMHPVECDPKDSVLSELYIRSGGIEDEKEDLRFFDFANFQVATTGMDASVAGQAIGELWVAYDVELYKPQVQPGGVLPGQFFRMKAGGTTGNDPLGPIQTAPVGNLELEITATGPGYDTIFFPERISGGRYLVTLSWLAPANATVQPVTINRTNMTYETSWYAPATYMVTASGLVTNKVIYNAVLTVDGHSAAGSSLEFDFGGAGPLLGQNCDVTAAVTVLPTNNDFL